MQDEQKELEGNLLLLLRSEQEKDLQLGLHLAANSGIAMSDLTDLVAFALFHHKPDFRELGERALAVHATRHEREFLAQHWQSTHRQGEPKPFFAAVGKLGKLPRIQAELLYRLAVRYTYRFPENISHRVPSAFLESAESKITPYGTLNLNRHAIPVLPPEIAHSEKLAVLESLSLENCGLRRIPPEIGALKRLTYLSLKDNQLTDLPDELGQLSALRVLEWTGNRIRHLPDCLIELTQVKRLRLYIAAEFDFRGLEACRHFRELDLRFGKGAGPFPQEMLRLEQIEELAAYARLWEHHFPDGIEGWSHLKRLDLTFHPEHPFPRFVRQLERLQTLKLSMVPHWVDELEVRPQNELRELALKYSRWREWPESWCNFPALEKLEVTAHKLLTALPEAFARLQQLRHLSFTMVGLEAFPGAILDLPHLETLVLKGTQITALPEDLDRLTQLRHLHLAGSEIRHLPDSIRQLKHLEHLELHNLKLNWNEIKTLIADLPNTKVEWT
ncbi:MAG: leucine-rich repeat domain-containing protein [Bacteroidota bacterium]